MLGPVVLLVLAVAVFTVRAFRLGQRRSPAPEPLRTFALVGAAGLVALAVAVVGVGLVGRPDRAEGLAVIGLFGYVVYLPLMALLAGWLSRR